MISECDIIAFWIRDLCRKNDHGRFYELGCFSFGSIFLFIINTYQQIRNKYLTTTCFNISTYTDDKLQVAKDAFNRLSIYTKFNLLMYF